jgi:ligand-binding sensor domain-containing protein
MKNGHIWMGSNDNGIFGFNAITQQFVFIPTSRRCHSSDHLDGFYQVKEDDTGNLWTGNDNNEVVYYDMAAKKFYFPAHQTEQYTVHGSINNIPGQEP